MNTKTVLMFAALLHDVGKIIKRSFRVERPYPQLGEEFLRKFACFDSPSLLEAVRYHERGE